MVVGRARPLTVGEIRAFDGKAAGEKRRRPALSSEGHRVEAQVLRHEEVALGGKAQPRRRAAHDLNGRASGRAIAGGSTDDWEALGRACDRGSKLSGP